HRFRTAPWRAARRGGESRMHLREPATECLELMRLDAAGVEQPIELLCLAEPAHAHSVFDNYLSVWSGPRCAAGAGCQYFWRTACRDDLTDPDIDVRGKTPVETQLFLAQKLPVLERGEIDERIADRTLDLVGVLASKQHPGDVGRDELHSIDGMWICAGLKKPLEGIRQGCGHGLSRFIAATMRQALPQP